MVWCEGVAVASGMVLVQVPPLPSPLLRVREAREKRNGLVRWCGGEEWDALWREVQVPPLPGPLLPGGGEGEEKCFGDVACYCTRTLVRSFSQS